MAELVYATVLGAVYLWVRIPLRALRDGGGIGRRGGPKIRFTPTAKTPVGMWVRVPPVAF